jgi:hypothetical protein
MRNCFLFHRKDDTVSLNWKEIDAVLEELPLKGSFVQGIVQPAFDALILRMYHPGTDHAPGQGMALFISPRLSGPAPPTRPKRRGKTEKPFASWSFLKENGQSALVSEARNSE